MRRGLIICILLIAILSVLAVAFSGQASYSYAIDEPIFEGAGNSSLSPYIIDSAAKLNAIARAVNNDTTIKVNASGVVVDRNLDENAYYRVESDIDMTEYPSFVGIGTISNPFSARLFDGGGYTISLNINTTENNVGLFGYYAVTTRFVNTIRDIKIKGSIISEGNNIGVFGYADFSLRRVNVSGIYVDGKIRGANNVGLIGYLHTGVAGSSIANAYNLALTYGKDSVGGIIGYKSYSGNAFYVNNCVVLGAVNGNRAGGIIGRIEQGSGSGGSYSVNAVHINNNFVKGALSGSNIGSIVGMHDDMLALYAESSGQYSDFISDNYYFTSQYVNNNLTASGNLGNYEDEENVGATALDITTISIENSYSSSFLTVFELTLGFPLLIAYPLSEKAPYLTALSISGGVQEYYLESHDLRFIDNIYIGFTLELWFDYALMAGDTLAILLNGEIISLDYEQGYTINFAELFSEDIISDGEQTLELSLNGGQRIYTIIADFSGAEGIDGTIITEGYGTVDYPYLISNPEQLALLNDYPDKAYKLINDIEALSEWTPIGSSASPFSGIFLGNGYKVINVIVTSGNYIGFFGYTNGAEIKDIEVEVNISGGSHVGGLIGYSKNTVVNNAIIRGRVQASSNAGGVAGTIYNTFAVNYTDIINYADIFSANSAGGIVGGFSSATSRVFMTRVYNSGRVSMNLEDAPNHAIASLNYNYFGLFYGYQIKVGAESLLSMNNSGAIFELYIKGPYTDIGIFNANRGYEIIGERIEGDYSVVTIKALFNGTIGTDAYTQYGCISNYGGQFIRITKPNNTYAYASLLDRTTATFNTNIFIDLNTITSYNFGQLASLNIVEQDSKNYVVVNNSSEFEHLAWIINGYIYGENIAGNTYENIELASVNALRKIPEISIKLAGDIDLTQSVGVYGDNNFYGIGWSSLMPYLGSLDGDGNSITININCPYGYQIGLLGAVSSNAGGISATASLSELKNLNVYGSIVGHTIVGLIGIHDNYAPSIVFNHDRNSTVIVKNVHNYAAIQAYNIAGGLLGITQSTAIFSESARYPESFRPIRARVIGSNNYGDVTASGDYGAGGLLGATGVNVASGVSIENSANYGRITSPKFTGGLAGRVTCHIELRGNNYNYGQVYGQEYAGGLVGYVELGLNILVDNYGVSGRFVSYENVSGTTYTGLIYGRINDDVIDESEGALFVGFTLIIGEATAGVRVNVFEDLYTTDTEGKITLILEVNDIEDISVTYFNEYMQPKQITGVDALYKQVRLPQRIAFASDNITDSITQPWKVQVVVSFYGESADVVLDYSDDIDFDVIGDELVYDYNIFDDSEYIIDLTVTLLRIADDMYGYLDAFNALNDMTEGSNADFYNAVNTALNLYNGLKAIYVDGAVSEDSKERFTNFLELREIEYYLLEEWLCLVALGEDLSSLYGIEYGTKEVVIDIVIHTLADDISYSVKVYYEYKNDEAKAIATHSPIILRKGEVITYQLSQSFTIDIAPIELPEFLLLSDYIVDNYVFDNTAHSRETISVITHLGDEIELTISANGDINAGEYEYFATAISGAKSVYYVLPDNYYIGELIIQKRAVFLSYNEEEFIYNGEPQGVVSQLLTDGEYILDSLDYAITYTGCAYTGDYYEAADLPINAGMYKLTLVVGDNFYIDGMSEVYFEIKGDFFDGETVSISLIVTAEDIYYGQDLVYSISSEGDALACGDYVVRFFDGQSYIMHPRKVGVYTLEVVPTNTNVTFIENISEFSILPKELYIVYQNSFEYNGGIQKAVPELVGVVGLDDVYIDYIYTDSNSQTIGMYWATITALNGEDKNNYILNTFVIEYAIIERELFANFSNTVFVYNGIMDTGLIVTDSYGRRVFDYEILVEDATNNYNYIPNITGEYTLTVMPLDGVSKINSATVTITVNKAAVDNIRLYSRNFIYSGQPKHLEVSTRYLPDGRLAAVNYIGNGKIEKGEFIVQAVVSDDLGYYETLTLFATLNIKAANIATNINVGEYVYDRYPKSPEYTREAFVENNGGYNVRYTGLDNSYNSYLAPTEAGSYRLTISANNLSINIIKGVTEFCIQKRYVSIEMSASAQFVYSAEAVNYPIVLNGILSGDYVKAVLSYNDNEIPYNAGHYTVYVEGLEGLSANNYYTDIRARAYNLMITPIAIVVTAGNISSTYGEEDATLTYSVSIPLLKDDVFSGKLARDTGGIAGNYEIYQNTLTAGNNYLITFVGGIYKIIPRIFDINIESGLEYSGYINKPYVSVGNILPSDMQKNVYSIEYIGSFLDAGIYQIRIRALDINYTVEENLPQKIYNIPILQRDIRECIAIDIPQKIYITDGWYPQPSIYDALTDYRVDFYSIKLFDQFGNSVSSLNKKGNYSVVISVNELNYSGEKSFDIIIRERVFVVPIVTFENTIIKHDSIQIIGIDDAEYSLDGITWSDIAAFYELNEDYLYSIHIRYIDGVNSVSIDCKTTLNPQLLSVALANLPQEFEWEYLSLIQNAVDILNNTSVYEYDIDDLPLLNRLIDEYNIALDKLNREIIRARAVADKMTGRMDIHIIVVDFALLISYLLTGLFMSKFGGVV